MRVGRCHRERIRMHVLFAGPNKRININIRSKDLRVTMRLTDHEIESTLRGPVEAFGWIVFLKPRREPSEGRKKGPSHMEQT